MSTFAEANRRYFDSISDSYESKAWFAKVNAQVTDTLRSRLDWIGISFTSAPNSDGKDVRLLDYACGTGLITRALGPYVTVTRGIDVSPNMVSTYNTRMASAGLSSQTVHSVHGDLFDKANPTPSNLATPEWHDFDIATVGFAFHHFEDVVHASRQLKNRLRPGGVLVITDFLEGGDMQADGEGRMIEGSEGNHAMQNVGHSHSHHHHHHHRHHQDKEERKHDTDDMTPEFLNKMNASIVVPHFTIDGVKQFFTEAGLVDVDVITLDEKSYMEYAGKKMWRTILVAKGRRPEEAEGAGKSEL